MKFATIVLILFHFFFPVQIKRVYTDIFVSFFFRLYEMEVVEVSPEVSFVVMVPSADLVCAVPGTREKEEPLLKREDLLLLPVQTFEMAHLSTYQRDLINRYSRLSSILETDTILAQHTHREVKYSKYALITYF